MRLVLIFFVFAVVEAKFSSWKNIDDDDVEKEKEKKISCEYSKGEVKEAGPCKNHYYICAEKKRVIAHCPKGFVYVHLDGCTYKEDSPSCPEYKTDLDIFKSKNKTIRDSICKRRIDGHYNFPCENTHYSCKNGTVTWHKCPKGLIYSHYHCMEDKCIRKEHVAACWPWYEGFKGQDPRCPVNANTDAPRIKTLADSKKEFSCKYKYDGHYAAGRCQNHFNICSYFKQTTGYCPKGMVYWKERCYFKRDVKHCPEYKTDLEMYHSKNETEKNSICEIRGDGLYKFSCENEYFECKDGKTIWNKCPDEEAAGFLYICTKRIHHEDCPEFDDLEVREIDPNRSGRRWTLGSSFFIKK